MIDTKYTEQFKEESKSLVDFDFEGSRVVSWESPSNIALVKYWGKHNDQLPQNPSLSFTLKNSKTVTRIVYQRAIGNESQIAYFFEDQQNFAFEEKIKKYFDKVAIFLPFLKKLNFTIYSSNTFPHSAGIASSASSFSALALCLCSIENDLFSSLSDNEHFYSKASFLARLGSGSACRSTSGKLTLWGKTDSVSTSSNELAVQIDNRVHSVFKTYHDAILIIDSSQKSLSSTQGHGLMKTHPFASARYSQANANLMNLLTALKDGDQDAFANIVENEAMTLHSLMLSSTPMVSLLKPNTLTVISKLIEFRKERGINFSFTLDAGPNIHILYPNSIRPEMLAFINGHLKSLCENGVWIDDELSDGPKRITYSQHEF